MRRALRVVFVVLLAFLVQSTILPYFKLNGVMFDLMSITLFTVGYALGAYIGIMAGALAGLIMEVSSGDLPALTAIVCVAAGGLGAYIAYRLRLFSLPGKRPVEHTIKRFAPMAVLLLFEMGKELIYIAYFYLTGMDISFLQFSRMLIAGIEVGLFSLILVPLLYNFLLRKPEDTFLARWLRKRQAKRRVKPVKPIDETLGDPVSAKGGTEA